MIRIILAVVAGYLSMAIAVFLVYSAAYLGLGTERAFKPESYETSLTWCFAMMALGVPAAFLGGWVCAVISCSRKAVTALATLVGVLGLLMAIMTLLAPVPEGKRTGDVPNTEAMSKAVTPAWVAFLNPIIGVVGVLYGGHNKLRRITAAKTEPSPALASA